MDKFLSIFALICITFFSSAISAKNDLVVSKIYPVGMAHIEYFDSERENRPMVMDVFYPAVTQGKASDLFVLPFYTGFEIYKNAKVAFDGRKYPLILLSHGRMGNRFNFLWLAAFLASHGYIVASMDHYFANTYYFSFEYAGAKIWQRPRDFSANITYLLNDKIWGQYIDPSKIGVAGHSQGGMAALWVGGAKVNPEKFLAYQRGRRNDPLIPEYLKKQFPVDATPAMNVGDKRVKAVFSMAPGAIKAFGFDEAGLKQLKLPTYLILGAGDTVTPLADNAGFVAKYVPNAQLYVIPGQVGHEIFMNICDEEGKAEFPTACIDAKTVDREKIHKLIENKALNFFDRYLKN